MRNNLLHCSEMLKKSDSIIGTAPYKPIQIFVEIDSPWDSQILASKDFPLGLAEFVKNVQMESKIPIVINGVQRNKTEMKNSRRVFILKKHDGLSSYDMKTFQVPREDFLTHMEGVLNSVVVHQVRMNDCYSYEIENPNQVLIICTHHERDRCCGVIGTQLFHDLISSEHLPEDLEIWKASHLGGHRYAPTMIELPNMRMWGRLTLDYVLNILHKNSIDEIIDHCYRGQLGMEMPYEQFAESLAFKKYLWRWAEYKNIKVESNWNKKQIVASGGVKFINNDNKEVLYSIDLKQTKTIKGQASCFKTKLCHIPVYEVMQI